MVMAEGDPFEAWVVSLQAILNAGHHLVIVEGATDKRTLAGWFQSNAGAPNHLIIFAHFPKTAEGKDLNHKHLVYQAIRALERRAPESRHVLGIVDADFMRTRTDRKEYHRNLFSTDTHDLDGQMFKSRAVLVTILKIPHSMKVASLLPAQPAS